MNFTEAWSDTCSTVGVAARTGNLTELLHLIENGRPVDVHDNRGWRPLHEAAAAGGSLEVLDVLLKQSKCFDPYLFSRWNKKKGLDNEHSVMGWIWPCTLFF